MTGREAKHWPFLILSEPLVLYTLIHTKVIAPTLQGRTPKPERGNDLSEGQAGPLRLCFSQSTQCWEQARSTVCAASLSPQASLCCLGDT